MPAEAQKQPHLIIFDCDGVLIDSELIACRVEAACLTDAGLPVTAAMILHDFVGMSVDASVAMLEKSYHRKVPENFAATSRKKILCAFDNELHAMPGVQTALNALTPYRCCVASGSHPERLRHSLELTGLWNYFTPDVFNATQVEQGKPAPDLFLFAAAQMGMRPQDCLVIEDSTAGVQAAVAAGMPVIGFTGGEHCPDDQGSKLSDCGAMLVIDHMSALPHAVEKVFK